MLTPFSSKRLPSFNPGSGVSRILALGGTTFLTGLPRRHAEQSGRPEARRIAELVRHEAITFNPTTAGFPDCYVLVSIPPDGSAPTVVQGPGSIHVRR